MSWLNNVTEIMRYVFSGTINVKDNGTTRVIRFMDFGKHVETRATGLVLHEAKDCAS